MRITPWHKHSEIVPELGTRPLRRIRDQIDRVFDNFFGWGDEASRSEGTAGVWVPDVDVVMGDKDITLRAEVAGIDPKDIDISVRDNTVILSGDRKEEKEEQKADYYCAERRYGSFQRSVELPPEADLEKASAEYDKGVLIIRFPRKAGTTPKRIEVKGISKPEKRPTSEPAGDSGE